MNDNYEIKQELRAVKHELYKDILDVKSSVRYHFIFAIALFWLCFQVSMSRIIDILEIVKSLKG